MNIGIIGAGAIANFLLERLNSEQTEEATVISVLVRDKEKYSGLEKQYGVTLHTKLDAFLQSGVDIVVEAANIAAVNALLPTVLKEKDVILISVGALADEDFAAELNELASKHHHTLHLPSGAVGGLDLLQNANAMETISSVTLTTRKPAHSLTDETLTEAKTIFSGKASEAIKQYPKNVNVSIVLSLGGIGIEQTKMNVIADPNAKKNMHQVEVKGAFGEATFTITNNPLPENPKTSYLAAMSILGTLKRVHHSIRIGG